MDESSPRSHSFTLTFLSEASDSSIFIPLWTRVTGTISASLFRQTPTIFMFVTTLSGNLPYRQFGGFVGSPSPSSAGTRISLPRPDRSRDLHTVTPPLRAIHDAISEA